MLLQHVLSQALQLQITEIGSRRERDEKQKNSCRLYIGDVRSYTNAEEGVNSFPSDANISDVHCYKDIIHAR